MAGLHPAHCQGNICAHLLCRVPALRASIQPSLVLPQHSAGCCFPNGSSFPIPCPFTAPHFAANP
ncbi:hypothetical protein EK904_002006 [Melospiza melodia maxima]|nr:hypothetical protein EK904_002006 [Melospiza melodia maxima]